MGTVERGPVRPRPRRVADESGAPVGAPSSAHGEARIRDRPALPQARRLLRAMAHARRPQAQPQDRHGRHRRAHAHRGRTPVPQAAGGGGAPAASGTPLDDVTESLRRRLAVEGAHTSHLQNCESMQRVHISPRLGSKPVDRVTIADRAQRPDVPALRLRARHRSRVDAEPRAPREPPEAPSCRRRQPGPSVPERPRARGRPAGPSPDDVVTRAPAPTRRGRRASAPRPRPTSSAR